MVSSRVSATLDVQAVTKAYGTKTVLDGVSFTASPGEFIVLVGPSGCGKSTMLRSIAGLESISSGKIIIGEREVTKLAPKDRNIAMVFQDYALYPHKNVYENIAFGLRIRRIDPNEIDRRVREAAAKLDLNELLKRRPAALSGGQRQRVAIGRAIVRKPDVFLFDEPLSNLDAKLRGSMRISIAKLHQDLKTTVLYVTHDQIEAMTLADRIIVLEGGRIQQMGSPLDLYYHPANAFVAQFIGSPPMNLESGELTQEGEDWVFHTDEGQLDFIVPKAFSEKHVAHFRPSQKYLWGFRADNLVPRSSLHKDQRDTLRNAYKARVVVTELLGPTTSCICDIQGREFQVSLPEPHRPRPGDILDLVHASKHTYLFDAASRRSLEVL